MLRKKRLLEQSAFDNFNGCKKFSKHQKNHFKNIQPSSPQDNEQNWEEAAYDSYDSRPLMSNKTLAPFDDDAYMINDEDIEMHKQNNKLKQAVH